MTRRKGLTDAEIKKLLEESDDDTDFDDDIDDPDYQDPIHNLRHSSDSEEGEMDIDPDTIPNNAKNNDVLSDSDTDTASLSSVDDMPSAISSDSRPVLWFRPNSAFQPRMTIPAESSPILLFDLNRSATELDVFLKMFPNSLINRISHCTNQRLEKLGKNIQPTDPSEIMLVLGCMLVISYNKMPKFSDYWSSHPSLGNVAIKNAISRDRCKILISKLYFAEPEKPGNASKTYYIDEVVSCLKQTFKECRSESSHQSIDESMTKFKGRSSLKQYMPMKPVKRGIKIWQRCDSKTGYVYDMNIYSGKETGEVQGTLGERVVLKLTETIRGDDVVLAFDRFFTSVHLMETLKYPAVGTCIKTRKDVPKFATKLSKRGEAEFLITKNGTLCARWLDSKEVTILSNCHEAKYAKVYRTMKDGSKEEFECPMAIEFYNKIMGGVDLADQMAHLYELDRKSCKWWKKVFFRLMMTAVVNSWIAYCELNHRKTPLLDFIVPLAEALMATGKLHAQYQRRKGTGRPSKTSRSLLNVGDHLPITTKTRRRCRKCAQSKKESRTKVMCAMCNVPLCIDCFQPYHI